MGCGRPAPVVDRQPWKRITSAPQDTEISYLLFSRDAVSGDYWPAE